MGAAGNNAAGGDGSTAGQVAEDVGRVGAVGNVAGNDEGIGIIAGQGTGEAGRVGAAGNNAGNDGGMRKIAGQDTKDAGRRGVAENNATDDAVRAVVAGNIAAREEGNTTEGTSIAAESDEGEEAMAQGTNRKENETGPTRATDTGDATDREDAGNGARAGADRVLTSPEANTKGKCKTESGSKKKPSAPAQPAHKNTRSSNRNSVSNKTQSPVIKKPLTTTSKIAPSSAKKDAAGRL